jgi:hypothetical protein
MDKIYLITYTEHHHGEYDWQGIWHDSYDTNDVRHIAYKNKNDANKYVKDHNNYKDGYPIYKVEECEIQ